MIRIGKRRSSLEDALMEECLRSVTLPNGWKHSISSTAIRLPSSAADEGVDIVNKWAEIYPSHGTRVTKEYGVPSLIVRLDTVYRGGQYEIIEIEDRPCGIGATGEFNPAFKEARDTLRKKWPGIKWVGSPDRVSDDELWLGKAISIEEAILSQGAILVRARPEDTAYHPLRVQSISTVLDEGMKESLVNLGYGTIVEWQDEGGCGEHEGYVRGLPSSPCVVKPLQGTRARNVIIHGVTSKDAPSKKSGDTRGIGCIERKVKEHTRMLCQKFIRPLELDHLRGQNAMLRLFFGYDPDARSFVPLHGAYIADRSLILHGSTTSVFGPVVMN